MDQASRVDDTKCCTLPIGYSSNHKKRTPRIKRRDPWCTQEEARWSLGLCMTCALSWSVATSELADGMETSSPHSDRLSGSLLSAAYDAGIDVNGAQIESHDGYTMISENGSWVIGFSANPTKSSMVSSRASFDAGICTGKFHPVMVIKNRLEWGAQTSCVSTASPNDLYRHSLRIELSQRNEGRFIMEKVSGYTPPNGPYSRVTSAVATNPCRNSRKARYDVVAYPTVHSVQFGPVISSLSGAMGCRVKA